MCACDSEAFRYSSRSEDEKYSDVCIRVSVIEGRLASCCDDIVSNSREFCDSVIILDV